MNAAASRVERIISGGQTGTDRAGLDAALALHLAHGGFCPAGRRAEDGVIPSRYELQELDSREYADRTRRNVCESDATLILCRGELRGGTRLTRQFARRFARPMLVINLAELDEDAVSRVHHWLEESSVTTLNVAGPRESQNAGIYDDALTFLLKVFAD